MKVKFHWLMVVLHKRLRMQLAVTLLTGGVTKPITAVTVVHSVVGH